MLELKHLTKIYCTKNGSPVKALEDINVAFPESGMIFLLGRSGSGKSTMLNLIGGLDKPTEGEIVLKGKSSNEFSSQDFDSFRNTYVGFIFQEYNVFSEFNVEENISLALELQKKPNDENAVNALLNRVGLKGYNYRKPNTLSGGEKQRLAIARALIKNPEIILADEPTGALDSNTGRDVLDTLKELSEHKLVIVVSHDREYATKYGDRIIELKDGKILKDVTKDYIEPEKINDKVTLLNEETILIDNPKDITKKEIEDVIAILKKSENQVLISTGDANIKRIKIQNQISEDGKSQIFKNSDFEPNQYDGTNVKFIRSKLPLKRAFKMGASSLRIKPFRLILTILLSVISFVLFGIASTCMMYDKNYSLEDALKGTYNDSERITKSYYELVEYYYIDYDNGGKIEYVQSYPNLYGTYFGVSEMNELNSKYSNVDFAGIFNLSNSSSYYYYSPSFGLNYGTISDDDIKTMHPSNKLIGFSDCGEDYAERNFTLVAGSYPSNKNEIAISSYIYELYKYGGNINTSLPQDFIGKTIEVSGYFNDDYKDIELTVTGIYNVGDIPEIFNELINDDTKLNRNDLYNLEYALYTYLDESYNLIGYVSTDFYDEYKSKDSIDIDKYFDEKYPNGLYLSNQNITENIEKTDSYCSFVTPEILETNGVECIDIGGNTITVSLGDNECLLPINDYYNSLHDLSDALVDYYNTLINNNLYEIASQPYLISNEVYQASKEMSPIFKAINSIKSKYSSDLLTEEYKNNIDTIINFLNSYYVDTMKKSLAIYKAQLLLDLIDDKTELNAVYDTYIQSPTDDNFNNLVSCINLEYEAFEDERVCYKAKCLFENAYLPLTMTNIYMKLKDGEQTELEFETLKNYVDENYSDLFDGTIPFTTLIDYIFNSYEIDLDLISLNTEPVFPTVYFKSYNGTSGTLDVKGFYLSSQSYSYCVSDSFINSYGDYNGCTWALRYSCEYEVPEDAKYNYLITKTQFQESDLDIFLFDNGVYCYEMTNEIYTSIEMILELITTLSGVFVGGAIFIGIFAGLLLANFISVSINNKKKEIGILRAVGARKNDVFKIFLSESFIISIISVFISILGSIAICTYVNNIISQEIGMKLLRFGVLNGLFILSISFIVALIATLIPVLIHSKKPPVESIREL